MKELAWKDYFYNLGNAINRLKEVLDHPQLDRLLAEPVSDSEFIGIYGTQGRNVLNIHEDPSTGMTTKLTLETELYKKSKEIDYIIDAAIQRFEFTIELFWKVLKKILAYEKVESSTPRDVLSKAYQYKLIDREEIWLAMLDDRNNTSHAYKEELAKIIFDHIKNYLPVFLETYQKLESKY